MSRAGALRAAAGPVLLTLVALPFGLYAAGFGWRGLTTDLSAESYLFGPEPGPDIALALHMLGGSVVTVLAPLQLIPAIRARAPRWHRGAGRLIVALSLVAAAGGLWFIAARGTIGGPVMDAGFALYGALLGLAAVQAIRFARAGDVARHRAWALRLFVLAVASLIFRLHYVAWFLLTGGIGSTESLDGPFDRIQVFAFYLPYLAAVELWLTRRPG